VDITESMVRAIARQAEAERNRRAKVINATGEEQAADKLVAAAKKMAAQSESMQLRYLATLYDVSHGKGSVVVFPFPLELFTLLRPRHQTADEQV
jgi:regulator of protease activity HflC (stomatin/prohibitin superfamily)